MSVEAEILVHEAEGLTPGSSVLFLDRDGVIVDDVHHLRRVEDIRLLPGIETLIRTARRHGASVAVVTNQSGLARGLFDHDAYWRIAAEINRQLSGLGCQPGVTIACPFHPDFTPHYDDRHERWRKPGPGMLQLVAERYATDMSRSILVGDNLTDLEAARRAGLPKAILLGKPLPIGLVASSTSFGCEACETLMEAAAKVDAFLAPSGRQ